MASGAASQLIVDAACVVVFGANHVESAKIDDLVVLVLPAVAGGIAATQNDVSATTGHVGRHSYGIETAGLGDDDGLVFVVLGVQHLVRDTALSQPLTKIL